MNELKNIFDGIPEILYDEFFEDLISTKDFKLERIVSDGHSSPENFWYDQKRNEFVIILAGSAELSFDDGRKFLLNSGDYMIIPAHQKHRVENTDSIQKTFWLALHY